MENMARYNREFLVPYLHDLCALYFAERKMKVEIGQTDYRIRQCSREHFPVAPAMPDQGDSGVGCLGWFLNLGGIFLIIAGYVCTFAPYRKEGSMLEAFLIILGIFSAVLGISIILSARNERDQNQRQYESKMKDYETQLKKAQHDNERNARILPSLKIQLRNQKMELEKIQRLIRLVYGANVIPKHYRDFYATVFLYDWFAYGGSDDLDMALNTYVLEEIKARLDRIIEQQSEMILNQRLMLAKQQESIDAQNRHNGMMRRKLDQLQATQDERLRYDRMIEANTAVTAYFAAATYLKS